MDKSNYTPMIQQYLDIKKDYTDSIVFFRLGDFYEMFFDDAIVASKVLEIALTGKDAGVKERVPMCGIPFHAYNTYAAKLLEAGHKVVIVEQIEDPSQAKGIVKRGVVKILTPGTILDDILNSKENNYLASLNIVKKNFCLSYADISTGDGYITILNDFDSVINFLKDLKIKEVLVKTNFNKNLVSELNDFNFIVSYCNDTFIPTYLNNVIVNVDPMYHDTIGMLLNYAINTQKNELHHFKTFVYYLEKDYLKLDYFTKKNLEISETLRMNQKSGSLLSYLDKTETAAGSRMLKKWLNRPLINKDEILVRQDFVSSFITDYIKREELKKALSSVYDLERIIGRISSNNANPKDLVQLRKTLSQIPNIKDILSSYEQDNIRDLSIKINTHSSLFNLLESSLEEDAPFTLKEGNIIKYGFNKDLDELKDLSTNSHKWLVEYEAKEKERLGVKTLKVGYNRVFGYYIEISKGQSFNLGDIEGYVRKQTLANSERYISEELKKYEDILLGAKDKIVKLEYELFILIRDVAYKYIKSLQELADIISSVDCYISLCEIAINNNFCKPKFNEGYIEIINGRHPVLEAILKEKYVTNNVLIDDKFLTLITGPNMSGKSTYMRMLAVIVILAQIGSFVPATSANLKIFDQIFTRIGASDDLSSGQSTFMVEMSEANYAIRNATPNSLILFDEIGRGTATYDGMALAQAILEYIHQKVKAVTLFSTHYHELTCLTDKLKYMKNIHVEALEEKGKVSFLHKVSDGPSDKSYGINVASLAGMPKSLIERSKQILDSLEDQGKEMNTTLFDFDAFEEKEEIKESEVENILRSLDLDVLSPREALEYLYMLKDKC